MASSKRPQPDPDRRASTSSLLVPQNLLPRRNSAISVDSQTDREIVAQALDHIHSTASRSDSLTTFNDFASPPLPSSEQGGTAATSQAPASSLSSIYTRLKASVAGSKDATQPTPPRGRSGEGDTQNSASASKQKPAPLSSQDPDRSASLTATSPALVTPKTPLSPQSGVETANSAASDTTTAVKPPLQSQASSTSSALPSTITPKHERHASRRSNDSSNVKIPTQDKAQDYDGDSQLDVPREATSNPPKPRNLPSEDVESFPQLAALSSNRLESNVSVSSGQDRSKSVAPLRVQSSTRPKQAAAPLPSASQHQRLFALHRDGSAPQPAASRLESAANSSVAPSNEARSRSPSVSAKRAPATQPPHPNNLIYQMQRKVLSRDFWMKDENAKVCFNCGETFTTFRRKHHCRLCGQIYCNSCTNLISGRPFGQNNKLRVCRTCEAMLNDNDSSDFSEDEEPSTVLPGRLIRFSDTITRGGGSPARSTRDKHTDADKSPVAPSGSFGSKKPRELKRSLTASGDPKRHHSLSRPSSSWSLKSLSNRSRSSSHLSHRSRNQHTRSLSFISNEAPPFHKTSNAADKAERFLPAFHNDSTIDPDLAPFMSDDGDSTDDDYSSISAAIETEHQDQPAVSGFTNILGALRRDRPRTPARHLIEHGMGERDSDNASIVTSRAGHTRRQLGNRTLSMGSLANFGSSPHIIKSDNLLRSSDNLYAMRHPFKASNLRGDDKRDDSLAPLEVPEKPNKKQISLAQLNPASLAHVKCLLRQFLRDTNVEHIKRWERALVPIFLRCAEDVDPSIHRGDDIDIRHYVKLKKAPGGAPNDSRYVSGIVFSKNIALKDMARSIRNPRILLVSFSLVYARHQQHFMSLEGVIAQEREYLKNLSNRIIALGANLVLVQGQAAGLVTGYLRDAGITVIYNVKSTVMLAASRCTQTRIVSSVDKLTMDPRGLGTCGQFDVKTHVYERSKISHVYLSGCQKDLGCTIVLRGADQKTLRKIKWIAEFMCYVAYNLKLETCLMRDEFIALPSLSETEASGISSNKITPNGDSVLKEAHENENSASGIENPQEDTNKDAAKVLSSSEPTFEKSGDSSAVKKFDSLGTYDSTVQQLDGRILSISPFVKLAEPYLLLRGQEQEMQMSRLRSLQLSQAAETFPDSEDEKELDSDKFQLVRPEMIYSAEQNKSRHVREILAAVHNSEYQKASHNYAAIQRRWETYITGVDEPYSPLSHQTIIALFSIVSTLSSDACVGPDLLGLDFYQEHDIEEGSERDMPLGEYIERLCDQVDTPCIAGHCERKMIEHHRQYVHGDGQLIVSTEKYPSRYRDMENTILMWSCCRICEQETQVVPMSGDSWKYSFAKYLELSFWCRPLHPRAGACPHDIHREHYRYFGFKNHVVRVQYDPINLVEITVPRGTITWAVDKDLRLKNEQYQRNEGHIGRFLSSVKQRLKNIKLSSIEADKRDACKSEIEELIKRANDQYATLTKNLQQKYMSSKFYEIIPMNQAVRLLQEEVAEWDARFSEFERSYFPSEKDLRKLAATQLSKAFMDREEPIPINLEYESSLSEKGEEGGDVQIDKGGDHSTSTPREGDSAASADAVSVDGMDSRSDNTAALGNDAVSVSRFNPSQAEIVQSLDLAVPENISRMSGSDERFQGNMAFHTPSKDVPTISVSSNQRLGSTSDIDDPSGQSGADGSDREQSRESTTAEGDSPRLNRRALVPPLNRSQTQPPNNRKSPPSEAAAIAGNKTGQFLAEPSLQQQWLTASKIPLLKSSKTSDQKSPEKPNAVTSKLGRSAVQSLIPRAISGRRYESRVSALAKHFEEMSREFEKERMRERLQRAARTRQSRAFPLASAKPIVEVFRDASEAVREREPSYEELERATAAKSQEQSGHILESVETERPTAELQESEQKEKPGDDKGGPEQAEVNAMVTSYPPSEVDVATSDTDMAPTTEGSLLSEAVDGLAHYITGTPEYPLEIAKEEKSSLMKMLMSFWSERSASGWSPLEYPLVATAHIFTDSDLIVREDEPSSLIAFTLASQDYKSKIQKFLDKAKAAEKSNPAEATDTLGQSEDVDVERVMLGTTATHMRYQFQSGASRMQCKVFYAESFDAIRRKCGVSDRFVESLSRCVKWDSKGGKTKSLFLKTHDERFVLKSLSPVETQAFLKFAPDYFDYMSKCLFHNLPSALAKMLGFYQVVIKNTITGVEFNWFLQVMENVFYEGPSNRMFDLKGSMRNRKVQSTGEKDEVLLDENLLDYISQSPVYVRNHSNTVLASSIQNDTLFCSKQNVMDYSLIVGLYDDRKELLVGIIDYIRTYTWDKKLESWIKDRGKHKATVRSPKEYRTRFRRSIPRYFPLAPSCWQAFGMRRSEESRARVETMEADSADEADPHETEGGVADGNE